MKTALAIVTAIILPGGFVVLGVALAAVLAAKKRAKQSAPAPVVT